MRSYSRGNFKVAANTLRANKWRSFLTMLGIIIGVSSVITVVSIGDGIKEQIGHRISHVGKNLITVRPGSGHAANPLGSVVGLQNNGSLSQRDVEAVRRSLGVDSVLPLGLVPGTVQAERGTYTDGGVVMTTSDFPSIINQNIAYGVFFSADDDGQNVAVLGAHAALKMFTANVPLGQTFSFRGQDFMVRGILNDFASPPLLNDVDFNNAIFIPYSTGQQITNKTAGLYEILAKSTDANPKTAIRHVESNLTKLHGDSRDFTVLDAAQSLQQTNGVLDLLTQLITGVAAISLLVGGIGIMNVMLVSVTERMHEIGIRKAVGATNQQILSEFMTEAMLLSVVGSIIGILISLVVNLILRILTSLTPSVNWKAMLVSSVVAILVGVLFGTAPALKAARKDPIAALRGE